MARNSSFLSIPFSQNKSCCLSKSFKSKIGNTGCTDVLYLLIKAYDLSLEGNPLKKSSNSETGIERAGLGIRI
ncbi:hypothetical protein WICPIJ_002034 [Wickerhamomyces pijperi]|uniref:Uncharacterized protein n=1 Tax=Wickerhamomyces pijperi TaxID=599730 RepID=A0A9P8QCJ2_WICPI|nr:hypothetical protein WICPIJ_002034 [Wickerhamomyces pijperi]